MKGTTGLSVLSQRSICGCVMHRCSSYPYSPPSQMDGGAAAVSNPTATSSIPVADILSSCIVASKCGWRKQHVTSDSRMATWYGISQGISPTAGFLGGCDDWSAFILESAPYLKWDSCTIAAFIHPGRGEVTFCARNMKLLLTVHQKPICGSPHSRNIYSCH